MYMCKMIQLPKVNIISRSLSCSSVVPSANLLNISMKQKAVLYGDEASPPVRFVMMVAHHLNVPYQFNKIDLFKAENRTASYKKINYLQKVPALDIGKYVIRDSHAIAVYLCHQSQDTTLYPNDPVARAMTLDFMAFNLGTLFPIDSEIFSKFFANHGIIDEENIKKWYTALDFVEDQLQKSRWLAGNQMRLSDLCCVATISSLQLLVPNLEKYKRITQWMEDMKKFDFYKINENGLNRLKSYVDIMKCP